MKSTARSARERTLSRVVEALEPRRMLAFGDVDTTFNGNGRFSIDFAGYNDSARDVALQKDGKILVVGETTAVVGPVTTQYGVILRLNANGSVDDGGLFDTTAGDTFGTFGQVTYAGGPLTFFTAVDVQADGKIIAAGSQQGAPLLNGPAPIKPLFVRYNPNGTLDTTFGTNGVYVPAFTGDAYVNDTVLQPDGKLVWVGTNAGKVITGRLTTSGQPDATFGSNGVATTSWAEGSVEGYAVELDLFGRPTVVGTVTVASPLRQAPVVARFTTGGVLDTGFDTDGKLVPEDFSSSVHNTASALAIREDGTIRTAGTATYGVLTYAGVTQVTGTGLWEPRMELGSDLVSTSIRIIPGRQSSDDFLVGGTYTDKIFKVADFAISTTIPYDGVFKAGFTRAAISTAMVIAPNGDAVLVGFVLNPGGNRDFAVARFKTVNPNDFGSVSGTVFSDLDGDGVRDVNETGIPSARVFRDSTYLMFGRVGVYDSYQDTGNETDLSVLTDASGNYTFHGIELSTPATIYVVVPLGSNLTLPSNGAYAFTLTPTSRTKTGVNWGIKPPSISGFTPSIEGSVFNDVDGDGLRDTLSPIEPDVVGRTVYLDLNKNGVLDAGDRSTVTDGGGNYLFDHLSLNVSYRVRSVLPAGWKFTKPTAGYTDITLGGVASNVARFATQLIDPDDTITEVNTLSANQKTVGQFADLSLGTKDDVDVIKFFVAAGQKVGFDVDSRNGSTLDTYLRVFNASGSALAANDNGVAPGEVASGFSYLAYTFPTSGTYYAAVSNKGNAGYSIVTGNADNLGTGPTGDYRLTLTALNKPAVTYQAESATLAGGTVAGNSPTNAGFTGTGYADVGGLNSSITFNAVGASSAGSNTLALRYANGSTINRPMDLYVNSVKVSTLLFGPTGSWKTYATTSVTVTLLAGNNVIKLVIPNATGGPNLDQMTVTAV